MFKVSMLLSNGYDILLKKEENNGQITYCIPFEIANTELGAKRKLNSKLKSSGIGYSFLKEIDSVQTDKESFEKIICCSAICWSSIINDKELLWCNYEKTLELLGDNVSRACSIVRTYIDKTLSVQKELEKQIVELHDQSEVKLEFNNTLGGTSIFMRTKEYYCALSFVVSFEIIDNEIEYAIRWHINRSFADGDKSDIYILFSTTMAMIIKRFIGEPVSVSLGNYLNDSVEINISDIFFESREYKGRLPFTEFIYSIIHSFEVFNLMMGLHGVLIGSISNQMLQVDPCCNSFTKLFDSKTSNFIIREEHLCFYDDEKIYIKFHNGTYNYKELFTDYDYEVLSGITGKLIYQKTHDQYFINYVDNDMWNIIKKTIKAFNIKDYQIICQSNLLFVVSHEQMLAFFGCFHHILADEERILLKDKRRREDELLYLNTPIQWKYPIAFERFEQLIADLLEYSFPNANVRLMGKSNNSDGGRDILVIFEKKTIIVQCKAYQKSVNKSNVIDIRDTIEMYNAAGYMLAVSSNITTPLIDHLCKLKEKYDVDWWTEREIFQRLRQYPILLNRYSDIIQMKNLAE